MTKSIKAFDGVKVTTESETIEYPDMTVFDKVVKCTEEQRKEIIRHLLMYHKIDLSMFEPDKKQFILELYCERPKCYTPNESPYPLCKGSDKPLHECKKCCLYEDMEEGTDY